MLILLSLYKQIKCQNKFEFCFKWILILQYIWIEYTDYIVLRTLNSRKLDFSGNAFNEYFLVNSIWKSITRFFDIFELKSIQRDNRLAFIFLVLKSSVNFIVVQCHFTDLWYTYNSIETLILLGSIISVSSMRKNSLLFKKRFHSPNLTNVYKTNNTILIKGSEDKNVDENYKHVEYDLIIFYIHFCNVNYLNAISCVCNIDPNT